MTFLSGRTALFLFLAGTASLTAQAQAQTAFTTLDRTGAGEVSFSAGERKPIEAGAQVNVTGTGFKVGQKVTLLYGTTALGDPLTVDAEGKFSGQIMVPSGAVPGNHPILVVAQGPYFATVADLKVSPTIPLSGQKDFEVTQAIAARGLYQSAYSAKNDALFVTSAVGRPPVRQSELVKMDGNSLKILTRITPQPAPAGAPRAGASPSAPREPGVYAVYGVAVDDSKDMLWVTNTRQNTVAVYKQSDLSLVKQLAPGSVSHPRDVAIDQSLGKAYVSAVGSPELVVFDTGKMAVARKVEVRSKQRGKDFSAASMSFDPQAHRLYAVSLATSEVAVINTQSDTVEKVHAISGARGAIGVSHDPKTGRIYVAAQGSDNLIVLDGESGAVIADTPVGAGALNVVFDPVKRLAYVSNRGAGTIAVTDAEGKLVANLGPAPMANHVALGKGGVVYAVDKSAAARGEEGDSVLRIRPRN